MHSVAGSRPESALQSLLMLRVLQQDSLVPQVVVPLRLPAAHAFGASADAAHLLPSLLTRWQFAQLLAGSCRACCMSVSEQMPSPPAVPALPVAQLPTNACRRPYLGFSGHPAPLGQSAASARHGLHYTPAWWLRVFSRLPTHAPLWPLEPNGFSQRLLDPCRVA